MSICLPDRTRAEHDLLERQHALFFLSAAKSPSRCVARQAHRTPSEASVRAPNLSASTFRFRCRKPGNPGGRDRQRAAAVDPVHAGQVVAVSQSISITVG